jgi:hypothetical protein
VEVQKTVTGYQSAAGFAESGSRAQSVHGLSSKARQLWMPCTARRNRSSEDAMTFEFIDAMPSERMTR